MRPVVKGSADQSVVIRIVDSADGTPETGVEHNTTGIDLWYRREGAAKVSLTEASLAALDSAHSDGGIEHIGDGYYRLDLPDAAVASGANGVMVGGTVDGMVVIGCYVPLVDVNPYDAVRGGMTALPNANADAAGGLPISDAGGLDLDTILGRITGNVALASVLGALNDAAADGDPTTGDTLMQYVKQLINVLMGTAGIVSFPSAATPGNAVSLAEVIRQIYDEVAGLNGATPPTAAAVADAVWDEATSGHTTSGTFGEQVKTDIDAILEDTGTTLQGELDGIQADTEDIQTRLPAALVNGRMDSTVDGTGMEAGALALINAEVVDALNVDTYAEPGQGNPGATISLAAKIGYLYKAWRNRQTQTASEYALYADNTTTKDQEAPVSDDGTTFDRGEMRTGA